MASALTESWLTVLADPCGPNRRLPSRPLRPRALTDLLKLADAHGVLSATVVNLRETHRTEDADRVVRASATGASSGDLLGEALSAAAETLRKRTALCLLIRRQVDELTDALGDRGVPVAVLKGMDFADRLYPDPGLRTFTDADLLVRRPDLDRADEVIRKLDYAPKPTKMKYDSAYGQRSYLPRNRTGGAVEIHWNLVNSPTLRKGVSVGFEDLEFSDRPAGDGGRLTPSPGSLLLIACVHAAASHCFDRLQLLCDVCQAAREAAGEIDADWVARAAQRTGAELALSTALDLAGRILHEPRCGRTASRCGLGTAGGLSRILLTRGVVLRAHARIDSFRRCLFRAMLKRS